MNALPTFRPQPPSDPVMRTTGLATGIALLIALSQAGMAAGLVSVAGAQQVPDTTFDVSIARASFAVGTGPRLAISEGHAEFHTATGRYRTFADLARADGFVVAGLAGRFTPEALAGVDLLVIANAMGDPDMSSPRAEQPAFREAEVLAVEAWVRGGGALLLIADHAPFGAATASLGRAFGVDMRNGYCLDPGAGNASGQPGTIVFTASYGLDTTHAIVRGRTPADRADTVATFTGQSLAGPEGSRSLLTLSATARDERVSYSEHHSGKPVPDDRKLPAAGRSQALAFEHGQGRVVVLGEAAMASAQLAGPGGRFRMGMNARGNHNKRFVTNTLRWLARAD